MISDTKQSSQDREQKAGRERRPLPFMVMLSESGEKVPVGCFRLWQEAVKHFIEQAVMVKKISEEPCTPFKDISWQEKQFQEHLDYFS
jgi:hypothetical protein